MCFSAPASFSAFGIIGLIGGRTIAKSNPGDTYLAIIPILFAVQQCIEGIIWLGFSIPHLKHIDISPLRSFSSSHGQYHSTSFFSGISLMIYSAVFNCFTNVFFMKVAIHLPLELRMEYPAYC